jgi:predicted glycogen debranching enzyme
MIEIDRETLRDFECASRLEWLETNGLGGWAGSTLSGAHTRRDHHLLRLPAGGAGPAGGSATAAGAGASAVDGGTVALAKLDELVIAGGRVHDLSCNRFPFVVAAPGVRWLAGFRRDLFPVFEYEADGIRLQKTIGLLDGESTLVVAYEVLAAPGPFALALRPLLGRRGPHVLGRAEAHGAAPDLAPEPAGLRLRWESGAELLLAAEAELDLRPDWWYRFELEEERLRGLDFQEDLWTPGLLRRELEAGDRFGVVVSAGPGAAGRDASELLAKELRRREKLLERLPVQDELTRILALAADQFLARGTGAARTLVAGYPGAEETTADSLIALPGLLLATGRGDEAKKLLRAHARAAAPGGALPDRLPVAGAMPSYDSLDASLWLFVAAWRYLLATGDEPLVRDTLLPALSKIAAAYERGAANGLRVAADGLLEAAPGTAAAGARPGKAVEINALWHNALATLGELGKRLGDAPRAKSWSEQVRRVQRRFGELFWNPGEDCLYDGVPGGDGSEGTGQRADPALRAHQVLAIGLPFPVLSKQRAQRLLRTLEARLLTPVGLRDLGARPAPAHANPSSSGSTLAAPPPDEASEAEALVGEAGAGHDGNMGRDDLAWPWLLGPFLAAQVWLRGATGRRQALQLLAELDPLLSGGVVGTVAELVGTEPPHVRQGHAAHAASVGELLRVYVDDLRPDAAPETPRRARPLRARPKPAGLQPRRRRDRSRTASGRDRSS